jgi:predicted RNA polymerase sigma factor
MIYEIFVQALSFICTSPALTSTIQIQHVSHSCEGLALDVKARAQMIPNAPSG